MSKKIFAFALTYRALLASNESYLAFVPSVEVGKLEGAESCEELLTRSEFLPLSASVWWYSLTVRSLPNLRLGCCSGFRSRLHWSRLHLHLRTMDLLFLVKDWNRLNASSWRLSYGYFQILLSTFFLILSLRHLRFNLTWLLEDIGPSNLRSLALSRPSCGFSCQYQLLNSW